MAAPCGGRGRNPPGEQSYLHGTPHHKVRTLARARVVGLRMRGIFVRSVAVLLHMSHRRGGEG